MAQLSTRGVLLYFKRTFTPLYAGAVAVSGEKSTQLLTEIENAFAHLAAAEATRSAKSKQRNIERAMSHLQRGALDAAKITWLHYKKVVQSVVGNAQLRAFCTNMPEHRSIGVQKNMPIILSI
ncbi:MAG: hypothetical protein R8J85_01135 [Mariprofundales bacterium]